MPLQFEKGGKKINLPGPKDLEDKEKRAALRKAIGTVNTQLFKLKKECANMNGEVGIVTAVVKVVEVLRKKVEKMANKAAKVGMGDSVGTVCVVLLFVGRVP